MIIRQLLLSSVLLSLAGITFADDCLQSKEFDVVVRIDGSDKENYEKRILNDFYCDQQNFEGEHFKIVSSINDEPVSFNDHPDIVKRAATTYFYLTKARNFWIHKMKSAYVASLPQLIVRVEMARVHSTVNHYLRKDIQYNNAFTVMAGRTPKRVPEDKKKEWGIEIWFSPKKVINVKEKLETIGNNPVTKGLELIERPITDLAESNIIYDSLDKLIEPQFNTDQTFESILILNLGTIATIKGIRWVSQYLDYVFVKEEFYMDTASSPEVIQHEFAHVALSEYLPPLHSLPVIEGMADYFVASANQKTDLYENIENIIQIRPKDALNEQLYHPAYELKHTAKRDFTLSVLWKVRLELEIANESRRERNLPLIVDVDQMMYEARKSLSTQSKIFPDLTRALVQTCRKMCTNKRVGINAINKALEQKGFN